MNTNQEDSSAIDMKILAERLQNHGTRLGISTKDIDEAWTLSHAIIDIGNSCRVIIDTHINKLNSKDIDSEEIYDTLIEIGEELRHILYHIRDSDFFRYLDTDDIS